MAHIINLSLQAFLLASSKQALIAALDAASDVDGEKLFDRFSLTLSSNGATDDTGGRKTWRATTKTGTQDPQHQEYAGIGRLSALEQLHDLGIWLHRSSQRDKDWLNTVGLQIGVDNMTRWSSWFMFIEKTLRKQSQIKVFMVDHDDELDGIKLTADDWDILTKVHDILQPFAGATLFAQSDKSSIGQSLEMMDVLLHHYEKEKVK